MPLIETLLRVLRRGVVPAALAAAAEAGAATLVVDDDGDECDSAYRSIQSAVNAAQAGDVVQVCAGDYPERVYIDKPLQLLGAMAGVDARNRSFGGDGETVVRSRMPFQVFADDVVIDGFTIRVRLGEDLEGQGIFAFGSGFQILNNLIEDDRVSGVILVAQGDRPSRIARNHFRGRLGIAADGEGAVRFTTIEDNLFRNASIRIVDGPTTDVVLRRNRFVHDPGADTACHDEPQLECRPGVLLALTDNVRFEDSELRGAGVYALRSIANRRLTVQGVTFADGRGAGILLEGAAEQVQLLANIVRGFTGTGVQLLQASGYRIASHLVEQNGRGIAVEASSDNAIVDNALEDNGDVGIDVAADSRGNALERNDARHHDELDCRDLSRGAGSLGTANQWLDNRGDRSEPAGLCDDPATP